MGIAREVHTEFPYLPASSLRGKIRSTIESQDELKEMAGKFFGQKIKDGQQPTEGEVWFADATLLFFPIASLSHHLVWITCPLWLDRWSRWLSQENRSTILPFSYREALKSKSALTTFDTDKLYLQTASLTQNAVGKVEKNALKALSDCYKDLGLPNFILERLVIINDEDCVSLVETGLQREVRIAIDDKSKTVKGGSFRSEEAIPPEAVLFFPWGVKTEYPFQENIKLEISKLEEERLKHKQKLDNNVQVKTQLVNTLGNRLQFGGLEGLGRGWINLSTTVV